MMPRYAVAALAVLAVSGFTPDARATVVLRSAELHSYSEVVPRGGPAQVTDTTGPFPNDANKFAGVGPEGLRVSVDELSGQYSSILGNLITSTASDSDIRVIFDVDDPSPFTYHRVAGTTPDFGQVRLGSEDGTLVITPANQYGDVAGVLAPGRYTFTARTTTVPIPPPLRGTSTSTIRDLRLTVVPEPTAMVFPAALLLCLARRRTPGRRPEFAGEGS